MWAVLPIVALTVCAAALAFSVYYVVVVATGDSVTSIATATTSATTTSTGTGTVATTDTTAPTGSTESGLRVLLGNFQGYPTHKLTVSDFSMSTIASGRDVKSANLGATYSAAWVAFPTRMAQTENLSAFPSIGIGIGSFYVNLPQSPKWYTQTMWFYVTTDYRQARRFFYGADTEKTPAGADMTDTADLMGASYSDIGSYLLGRYVAAGVDASFTFPGSPAWIESMWLDGTSLYIAWNSTGGATLSIPNSGDFVFVSGIA